MRFLDEKGRIFGLFNVIDATVVLMVLLVLAGAIYKVLLPKTHTEPTTVEFVVRVCALPPESAKMVKVGDRMVAGANYVPVTVQKVEVEPAFSTETDATGRKVIARDPYFKDLTVTLQGSLPITTAQIKLGNQEIRAGREYFLKSLTYEFKGTIIKVTLNPSQDKPKP